MARGAGSPSSSGGQNTARYAYFPGAQRLAIDRNGPGHDLQHPGSQHRRSAAWQQGGQSGSMSFSSQFGTFGVELAHRKPCAFCPAARALPRRRGSRPPRGVASGAKSGRVLPCACVCPFFVVYVFPGLPLISGRDPVGARASGTAPPAGCSVGELSSRTRRPTFSRASDVPHEIGQRCVRRRGEASGGNAAPSVPSNRFARSTGSAVETSRGSTW